ncbi:hypothetical protein C8Q70DRAFT_680507 [Cubamyces menziesii]|nr:hypothetical protein C8Q70DRAFT_680507 [Cubamyces menziesii]
MPTLVMTCTFCWTPILMAPPSLFRRGVESGAAGRGGYSACPVSSVLRSARRRTSQSGNVPHLECPSLSPRSRPHTRRTMRATRTARVRVTIQFWILILRSNPQLELPSYEAELPCLDPCSTAIFATAFPFVLR